MSEPSKCELCGEPMPPGEEVFTIHGYSGPCPKPPLPKASEVDELARALAFLKTPNCRFVSSGDLTVHQIAEAQACGRFYVEPGGGLGWAALPWELTTAKDEKRSEARTREPSDQTGVKREKPAIFPLVVGSSLLRADGVVFWVCRVTTKTFAVYNEDCGELSYDHAELDKFMGCATA